MLGSIIKSIIKRQTIHASASTIFAKPYKCAILQTMYKRYGNKFMCFSPPVMLATFLLEFGFAFYVLWRYKLTQISRLVVIMLSLLGIFQLTEYMICGGLGLGHIEWARLGYVSITLMPAVGLHIVMAIAGKISKPLLYAAYATALTYVVYFATAGSAIMGHECTANYAIFKVSDLGSYVFALYYYGWLFVAMGLAAYWARRKPKHAAALRWMTIGYASFIIPTTFANIIDPSTIAGIPSIMCGFAALLAVILTFKVLPLAKVPVVRSLAIHTKQRQV